MASKYLIPEPTDTNWKETGYTATTIYRDTEYGDRWFGACKLSSEKSWWAIGMIANVDSTARPIVLSNVEEYANVVCDRYTGRLADTATIVYEGKTYYYTTENMYAVDFNADHMTDNTVPLCSDSFGDYESAVLKLIELYKAEGGVMGENSSQSSKYEKISYSRINWQDDGPPDISAENLGKMDEAIYKLSVNLDAAHEEAKAQYENLMEYGDNITD